MATRFLDMSTSALHRPYIDPRLYVKCKGSGTAPSCSLGSVSALLPCCARVDAARRDAERSDVDEFFDPRCN